MRHGAALAIKVLIALRLHLPAQPCGWLSVAAKQKQLARRGAGFY